MRANGKIWLYERNHLIPLKLIGVSICLLLHFFIITQYFYNINYKILLIYPSAGRILFPLLGTCELWWEHALAQACTDICFHFSGCIPRNGNVVSYGNYLYIFEETSVHFSERLQLFPFLSQSVMSSKFSLLFQNFSLSAFGHLSSWRAHVATFHFGFDFHFLNDWLSSGSFIYCSIPCLPWTLGYWNIDHR